MKKYRVFSLILTLVLCLAFLVPGTSLAQEPVEHGLGWQCG